MNISLDKKILRKSVYDNLFKNGVSNRENGDYGKIPDFKGSDVAAMKLANTKEWKNAKTIFSSPDSAQIPVRYIALKESKNIIMASPNLNCGYLFLEAKNLVNLSERDIKRASTKEGAFKYCSKIDVSLKIDLVVEGSVAVDKFGNRIGKGKGFADREISDLFNKKLISSSTPLATTIHPLQLVDYVPMDAHDKKLNMIVTTEKIIRI